MAKASPAKKTASKKPAPKKPANPKGAAAKKNRQPLSPRQKEIIGVAVLALSVLLFCCLILAPAAGETSSALGAVSLLMLSLMRFLAGRAAFTLPLCLLIYSLMLLAGRNRLQGGARFSGLLLLWLAFWGMFSLAQPLEAFMDYISFASRGGGGGFIGGLLAFGLQTAFGSVGSLIILLALAIIGILIFSDTPLIELLRLLGRRLAALKSRWAKAAHTSTRPQEPEQISEGAAPPQDQRRPPLIISHDDPAPIISDPPPEEPEEPPAPTIPKPRLNRFAMEFLPNIGANQEPENQLKLCKPQPDPDDFPPPPPEKKAAPKKQSPPPAPEKQAPPVIIDGELMPSAPLPYQLPPIELIEAGIKVKNPRLNKAITDSIGLLETALGNFGVKATVTQVVSGPAVTRYELQPAPGVKVARIVSLSDDIALALAATAVRIEAPIPGKSAIGIEVAREQIDTVYFREVMESPEFSESSSKLSFALGKNIAGEPIVGDLSKMPHLLIAGSTGSGKSICVNSILCSILYKAKPTEVKLMLIDPKKVEMSHYNELPHLVAPVVTDSKKAANALKWVVNEMESRYSLFVSVAVKDFASYNLARPEEPLPQIVVVIDELADLMMVAKHDVEDAICRIAQMARAAGIYLLVATQRPSVDVITGLIKANIPSRIAFAVSSYTDSRTILDMGGAEKLLGRGDMLYAPIGANKPLRVQGSFMKESDIIKLVEYCKAQAAPHFVEAAVEAAAGETVAEALDDVDELFFEAGSIIISSGQASTSFLQRRLSIGNPRAARLIDQLAEKGVVGGPKGAKPRDILMSMEEFSGSYGDV